MEITKDKTKLHPDVFSDELVELLRLILEFTQKDS